MTHSVLNDTDTLSVCIMEDSTREANMIKYYLDSISTWDIHTSHISIPGQLEEALQASVYELIVMDYRLRNQVSGLDMLKKIRTDGYVIPTILAIGYGEEKLVSEMYRYSLTEYLPKSEMDSVSLEQVIDRLLIQERQREHPSRGPEGSEKQVREDLLTGLFNREYLIERMREELHRYQRYDQFFSVIFLELDGMAEISKHFGHTTGHYLYQQIGEILKKETRLSDTAARMDEDVFCLLLLNTPHESIHEIAARVQDEISTLLEAGPDGEPMDISCNTEVYKVQEEDQTPRDILNEI